MIKRALLIIFFILSCVINTATAEKGKEGWDHPKEGGKRAIDCLNDNPKLSGIDIEKEYTPACPGDVALVKQYNVVQVKSSREHHANGFLYADTPTNSDGFIDGLVQIFFFKSKQLKQKISYKNGYADGAVRLYYKNGQIRIAGDFKCGLLDGVLKIYTPNAELLLELVFKDGEMLNGKCFQNISNKDLKAFLPSIFKDITCNSSGAVTPSNLLVTHKGDTSFGQPFFSFRQVVDGYSNFDDEDVPGDDFISGKKIQKYDDLIDIKIYASTQIEIRGNKAYDWQGNLISGVVRYFKENGDIEQEVTYRNGEKVSK